MRQQNWPGVTIPKIILDRMKERERKNSRNETPIETQVYEKREKETISAWLSVVQIYVCCVYLFFWGQFSQAKTKIANEPCNGYLIHLPYQMNSVYNVI